MESLTVQAARPARSVMFYNMLNQGNKRGKETQVLALDCERILTDRGEKLARVSIVNFYGNIVFDTLVKPCRYHTDRPVVLDYREWITGIKAIDLEHAPTFGNIEPIIQKIVAGKTIVGHSLADDFKILSIDTRALRVQVRDISTMDLFMLKVDKDSHSPVREVTPPRLSVSAKNSSASSKSSHDSRKLSVAPTAPAANYVIKKRKLKDLADDFLNARIQEGHHSSVIDARAALALYRLHYEDIETSFRCQQALDELQIEKDRLEISQQEKEIDK